MKKWLAILLGLLALVLLGFFCAKHHGQAIQQDINNRTTATLSDTGLAWATATTNGRDVQLTGTAPSAIAQLQAERIAESVAGVRAVDNQTRVGQQPTASAKPAASGQITQQPLAALPGYTTNIQYDGEQLSLTGSAPSVGDVNRLVLLARQQLTPNVNSQLVVKSPGPLEWESAAAAVVPQLNKFSEANISLTANTVALAGELKNNQQAAAITGAINAALPTGYSGVYALQAATTAKPNACPPVKTCPSLPACPPPPTCPKCPATDACPKVQPIALAPTLPLAETIPLAEPLAVTEAADISAYEICQSEFNRLLAGGSDLLFRISKAEVTSGGRELIQQLADVANQCPQANLQVAGHTDSRGPRAMNQALSERRASAVKQLLAELGVENNRLTAVGYGESAPIASNQTINGRQINRRVEIIVEGQ